MADNVDGVPPAGEIVITKFDKFLGLDHPCAHWRLSFMIAAALVVFVGLVGLIVGAVRKGDKAGFAMGRFMRDAALPGLAIGMLISSASLVFMGKLADNKVLIGQSLALATFFFVMFGLYSASEGHLFIKDLK